MMVEIDCSTGFQCPRLSILPLSFYDDLFIATQDCYDFTKKRASEILRLCFCAAIGVLFDIPTWFIPHPTKANKRRTTGLFLIGLFGNNKEEKLLLYIDRVSLPLPAPYIE